MESKATDDNVALGDKDSGIGNCNNYPASLPTTPIARSVSHNSTNGRAEATMWAKHAASFPSTDGTLTQSLSELPYKLLSQALLEPNLILVDGCHMTK